MAAEMMQTSWLFFATKYDQFYDQIDFNWEAYTVNLCARLLDKSDETRLQAKQGKRSMVIRLKMAGLNGFTDSVPDLCTPRMKHITPLF